MRKTAGAIAGAVLGSLVLVTSVAAADPTAAPTGTSVTGPLPAVLGLSQNEIRDMRHDGMSLEQIAAKQAVDVQKVIEALVARWQERIDARVANGALTAEQGAALKSQVQTKATEMVNNTAPGGMQGAAVGAGPQTGADNGTQTRARDGSGTGSGPGPYGGGTCDGAGPHGPGRP